MDKKLFAFYLPQFHENDENNAWWGKGFTEWDNVKNAKPFLVGQNIPRIPLNSHYYDLSKIEELARQGSLAKEYGIDGFSIYHYWSLGKRLLSKPISLVLENKNIHFPFHLTWANHSWVRSWRNSDSNGQILRKQEYEMNQDSRRNHIKYISEVMKDKRYNRYKDKLIFNIYKPSSILEFKSFANELREYILRENKEEIILNAMYTHKESDESWINYIDNIILFQPGAAILNSSNLSQDIKNIDDVITILKSVLISSNFPGKDFLYKIRNAFERKQPKVFEYKEIYKKIIDQSSLNQYKNKDLIIGCFIDWDNTPRYAELATVMNNFSLDSLEYYLKSINEILNNQNKEILFINAWNEWGESAYLEPDSKLQYSVLEIIKNVFKD